MIQCYDPALSAQLRRSEAKVAELQAEYSAEFVSDRAKAQVVRDKLESEQANLALARERAVDLVARAKTEIRASSVGVSSDPQVPRRVFPGSTCYNAPQW